MKILLKLKTGMLGLYRVAPLIWLLFYLTMSMNANSNGYSSRSFNHEWHALSVTLIIYLIHAVLFNHKFKKSLGLSE